MPPAVSLILLLLGGLSACSHAPSTAPAWDGPSWAVLYGAQARPRAGGPRGPECRVQADGQQVCGHHCRTGRDGRVACAQGAEGRCEVGEDGRARCTESPPAPSR